MPGENAVVISLRNQDNVIKIDRDTDELAWVLGGPPGRGDFEMDDEDRFLRQHSAEPLENGNIILFDNGMGARPWSRAAEYALTFHPNGDPDRADLVWEFRDETMYSTHKSDADRLANGNTLIAYSHLESTHQAVILEVNADAEVLWDLRSPPEWRTYRAVRERPYYGHVVIPEEETD